MPQATSPARSFTRATQTLMLFLLNHPYYWSYLMYLHCLQYRDSVSPTIPNKLRDIDGTMGPTKEVRDAKKKDSSNVSKNGLCISNTPIDVRDSCGSLHSVVGERPEEIKCPHHLCQTDIVDESELRIERHSSCAKRQFIQERRSIPPLAPKST